MVLTVIIYPHFDDGFDPSREFNFDISREEVDDMMDRISKMYDGVVEQCEWTCPECGKRCGGIKGHSGYHQCPTHLVTGER